MKLSGFSFVRNGVRFDYPFLESLQSLLLLCDEVVVAVGNSDDTTLSRIRSLHDNRIRILETSWDDSLRSGGSILSQQTNLALDHVSGDWAMYLQADEVIHESDIPLIMKVLKAADPHKDIEGLLFPYHHFYGSYSYVGNSRQWYRREIRTIRTGIGVRSWGDAQGFRIGERKLRVKLVEAPIYHYGWVKSPKLQQDKQKSFNRYWHDDSWMKKNVGEKQEYDYSQGGRLRQFEGTHPGVMMDRIQKQNWEFSYNPHTVQGSLKDRILDWFESKTGLRLGEYRNYELLS